MRFVPPPHWASRLRAAAQIRKRKLGQILLHSPLHALYLKIYREPPPVREYRAWLAARAPEDRAAPESVGGGPRISVLMAVHNPKREWLEAAIASVRRQGYPSWQLCICDDASAQPWVLAAIRRQAAEESRIRVTAAPRQLGISGALNQARSLAQGDYIGTLDHDDFLSSGALRSMAEAIREQLPDLLYSDEEYVDVAGAPLRPIFKPGWSPELLVNSMYMGHLVVVSRERFDAAGGFRGEYDGAQDYDLALRLTDGPANVVHIPRVLYHWRQHAHSTALKPSAKPYSSDAGRRALEDAVRRRGWDARVDYNPELQWYQVRHVVRHPEPVSIVLISGHGGVSAERLERATAYPEVELIPCPEHGDWAETANAGAHAATTGYLFFLDGALLPVDPDWLTCLVAQARRTNIGAVGALLLRHDGSLHHAGIAVGMLGGIGYPGNGLFHSDFWPWLRCTRNVSAVSGACLGIRREVFERMGGFDRTFGNAYCAVDLCLRLQEQGYEIVLEQGAALRFAGPGIGPIEAPDDGQARFRERWSGLLARTDPYYNLHLRMDREDTSLRPASAGAEQNDIETKGNTSPCK